MEHIGSVFTSLLVTVLFVNQSFFVTAMPVAYKTDLTKFIMKLDILYHFGMDGFGPLVCITRGTFR